LDWIGLSSVLRPRQHSIGYMGLGYGFTGQKTQLINRSSCHFYRTMLIM